MRNASQLLLTVTVSLIAAGVAALAFALLPPVFFVVGMVGCTALALAVWGTVRRDGRHAVQKAAADANAARLTERQRKVDTLKAREQALEKAQLAVIADFRGQYGL